MRLSVHSIITEKTLEFAKDFAQNKQYDKMHEQLESAKQFAKGAGINVEKKIARIKSLEVKQ